jgi:hypothetical protein
LREGRWKSIAALAASITPAPQDESDLLNDLARQASLHECAARILEETGFLVADPLDLGQQLEGESWPLVLAGARNCAALNGDPDRALALLRQELDLQTDQSAGRPLDSAPRRDVRYLWDTPLAPSTVLRVIGVTRPAPDHSLTIGDAGCPITVRVAGSRGRIARGTPIEVLGRWDSDRRTLGSCAITALGEVPDFVGTCERVEQFCAKVGFDSDQAVLRFAAATELEPSVARARCDRHVGEWGKLVSAADILEEAFRKAGLTLDVLARVHATIIGQSKAHAGQLRKTPAVVRWNGVITYRPPGVEIARRETQSYLNQLSAELSGSSHAKHPVVLAAKAVASLTSSHPFSDGNGRVARAVATWLLLRSGYQRRGEGTLSTFFDIHVEEHYGTLRDQRIAPWSWQQFFCDAVLTTFERARS